METVAKPCKHCGKTGHYPFQCPENPERKNKSAGQPKPCKYCERPDHFAFQCSKNPYLKKFGWKGSKAYEKLKKTGSTNRRSHAQIWEKARKQWFIENPADYYVCYLCSKSLMPYETTLDHVIPRSRAPHLRYEFSNLKPCCWKCNTEKGSKVLEESND